jgi:hypothetical protein
MSLRSPCDPIKTPCDPPAIPLPIGLLSACDPLRSPCVQSPHTPVRIAGSALGLGARVAPTAEGRGKPASQPTQSNGLNASRGSGGRLDRPHRPQHSNNCKRPGLRHRPVAYSMTTVGEVTAAISQHRHNWLLTVTFGHIEQARWRSHTLPRQQLSFALVQQAVEAQANSESPPSVCRSESGAKKGFRARSLMTFNTLGRKDPREPGASDARIAGDVCAEIDPSNLQTDPRTPKSSASRQLDLSLQFRGPSKKLCCRLVTPKIFGGAMTQKRAADAFLIAGGARVPCARGLTGGLFLGGGHDN